MPEVHWGRLERAGRLQIHQPDALPDGFNDSSFHLSGTNAKGYFIGANYGLDENTYMKCPLAQRLRSVWRAV